MKGREAQKKQKTKMGKNNYKVRKSKKEKK